MASKLEEDLCCPVCIDIFKDPVILSCSHNFCKDCVESCWKNKEIRECPLCKRRSSKGTPINLALKNLCEAFLLERDRKVSDDLCTLHSEKLKLFCLNHQQSVCVICRDSEEHNNHRFRPINEAARQHRKKLQDTLESLKEKLKVFEECKVRSDITAEYIKVQARLTKRQIKEQFKKIHTFLNVEEEARLAALREEEEQKSQVMKEKMEALIKEMAALSDTIKATEEELRAEDIVFLQNYKAAVERVQQRPQLDQPELPSAVLIDVAKHLGNLSFSIWINMKEMVSYTPVVLDPNTVYPELLLSKDLTSVKCVEVQQLPENPERFDYFCSALGSKVFDSGIHYWDVDVGDSVSWLLGMLRESAQRKGKRLTGLWAIGFCEGVYTECSPSNPGAVLQVQAKLERIKVRLDLNSGRLSFYDLNTDTHIHTFILTLSEKLLPYINTIKELKILPMNVTVMVK